MVASAFSIARRWSMNRLTSWKRSLPKAFQNLTGSVSAESVEYEKSTRMRTAFSGGIDSSVTNAGMSCASIRIEPRFEAGSVVPSGRPSGQLHLSVKYGYFVSEKLARFVNRSALRYQCES